MLLQIVNVTVYNLARTEPTMYTAPSPFDELTTHRLERPLEKLVPAPVVARMRRARLALMVGGAIGLIPWIVFLVITLPANYVAPGFDVLRRIGWPVHAGTELADLAQLVEVAEESVRVDGGHGETGRRHGFDFDHVEHENDEGRQCLYRASERGARSAG